MYSEIIAELLVIEAAMNLVMAIAKFAPIAAKIVLCEDSVAIPLPDVDQ